MTMDARNPVKVLTPIIGCLVVMCIVFLLVSAGLTQQTVLKGMGVDGFRELKWGTSIEQASMIYKDLGFDRYVISNGNEEPAKVYVRGVDHGEIEEVRFDTIEYWFKEDRFYRIRAVLHSRIGPRTLVTRAENSFDKMNGRFRNRYGDPSAHKVDYVTEFIVVVKEATWIVDHSAITIKYEGAGRANEDRLILTMKEIPKR
jgi:hypothetical protein